MTIRPETVTADVSSSSNVGYTHILDEPVRILVVDDDPIQREFAAVYLSTPVAEIIAVASAEHGLLRARNEKFDLVIADYEMPGMNGIDLVKAIRADAQLARLPVIMVTSHEDIGTIDAAYRAGATSFITKPVNWRLLSYQIRYVLRASALMHGAPSHE